MGDSVGQTAYYCEVFDAQMGSVCQKQCPECRRAEKDDLMNLEQEETSESS